MEASAVAFRISLHICSMSILHPAIFSSRGNRTTMNTSMVPQCTAWLLDAVKAIHTRRGHAIHRVWALVFTHSRVNTAMYIAQIARNEAINARTLASLAARTSLKERAP